MKGTNVTEVTCFDFDQSKYLFRLLGSMLWSTEVHGVGGDVRTGTAVGSEQMRAEPPAFVYIPSQTPTRVQAFSRRTSIVTRLLRETLVIGPFAGIPGIP